MRYVAVVAATIASLLGSSSAVAQSRPIGSGTAVGVTVQLVDIDDEGMEVPAVGLHVTVIKPSGFAFDFGLATLPTALAQGELLLAPDIGIGGVIGLWGSGLMIKGGLSAILLEGGTAGGLLGAHLGVGVLVRTGKGFGIRAEVVPRVYAAPMVGGFLVTTYGIGITSLPRRP